MKPHPLAEILHAIADGKTVQFKYEDNPTWFDFQPKHPGVNPISAYVPSVEWRVKPSTVIINGIECPAGIDVAPPLGATVWVANLLNSDLVIVSTWGHTDVALTRWLKLGIVHLSRENALQMAKAMLAFKESE